MLKNVIVVGAPRSGTSLTAAVFARKGYFVGHQKEEFARQGNYGNPFGYYEADDLVEHNVELFKRVGYDRHNTWMWEPIPEDKAARIYEIDPITTHRRLALAYDARSPWVWKDPRLCFTLPYWWKLVDTERTAVVLVVRDPMEVYWSWRRFRWASWGRRARAHALLKIEQHVRFARRAVESLNIPHVEVSYADYVNAPELVAGKLGGLCELELAVQDLNFRPELNHNRPLDRLSTYGLILLAKLPQEKVMALEQRLPRQLIAMAFPEKRLISGTKNLE